MDALERELILVRTPALSLIQAIALTLTLTLTCREGRGRTQA